MFGEGLIAKQRENGGSFGEFVIVDLRDIYEGLCWNFSEEEYVIVRRSRDDSDRMARLAGREGVKHGMDQLGGPDSDNDVANVGDGVSDDGVETRRHTSWQSWARETSRVGRHQRSNSWCAIQKSPPSPFAQPPSRRSLSYLQSSFYCQDEVNMNTIFLILRDLQVQKSSINNALIRKISSYETHLLYFIGNHRSLIDRLATARLLVR